MELAWRYTGIRVRDLDKALRFFCDGLGMRVRYRQRIKETGGTMVELVSDASGAKHVLELNWYPPRSKYATRYTPGEALDHLAFRVRHGSLKDAIARLEAHGGKLRIRPFKEGRSILAYVDSPDGHTIELLASKP
jgi:lactoylglutathione lyase